MSLSNDDSTNCLNNLLCNKLCVTNDPLPRLNTYWKFYIVQFYTHKYIRTHCSLVRF